jgi:hypothetical protein
MSLVIGYDVPDLTHLRYFFPFVSTLDECQLDVRHRFFHTRKNAKYNGLGHGKNWSKYERLLEHQRIEKFDADVCSASDVGYDVLVTVEAGCLTPSARHVAVSHGLDCDPLVDRLVNCHAYVCGPTVAGHPRVKDSGVRVKIPPCPVSMFTFDELQTHALEHYAVPDRKVVTLLYPDAGHAALADAIVDELEDAGYFVYVKQRRKWQPIGTQLGMHVYDDLWYPSEALMLPLVSDVTIGFGSTACLDLVEVGVNYVNVDVWPRLLHPDFENYTSVQPDVSVVISATMSMLCRDRCHALKCSREDILKFVCGLVK